MAVSSNIDEDDARLTVPVFTFRDAAFYLGQKRSTLHAWSRPARGRPPVITSLADGHNASSIPFLGFAEAYVLSALREAGVPMQRIRPAVDALKEQVGLEHALTARNLLYTDGQELLWHFASDQREGDDSLTVVRTGQKQFRKVIESYLQRIQYAEDGYAARLRLPTFPKAEVIVDPSVAFGRPLLVHGGARVEDVLSRQRAGEPLASIARDYEVPVSEVENVVHVAEAALNAA